MFNLSEFGLSEIAKGINDAFYTKQEREQDRLRFGALGYSAETERKRVEALAGQRETIIIVAGVIAFTVIAVFAVKS
jgi:hypothetical protein